MKEIVEKKLKFPSYEQIGYNALADNVTAQVIRDEERDFFLHINQTPIAQWFREQFGLSQKETQRREIRL